MKSKPLTIISGATRGLGYAMAEHLARQGGHLITLNRQPVPELAALAQEHKTELTEVIVDLVDAAALEQAAEQIIKVAARRTQGLELPIDSQCRCGRAH